MCDLMEKFGEKKLEEGRVESARRTATALIALGRYNRLWKLLIDKRMTKTEMRKVAGISTNILAKMGKDELVAMESLAKIATALQCGLDDIVEVTSDGKDVCNEV